MNRDTSLENEMDFRISPFDRLRDSTQIKLTLTVIKAGFTKKLRMARGWDYSCHRKITKNTYQFGNIISKNIYIFWGIRQMVCSITAVLIAKFIEI